MFIRDENAIFGMKFIFPSINFRRFDMEVVFLI